MTNDIIDYDPCPHGEHHPSLCATCDGKKPERVVVYYTDGGEGDCTLGDIPKGWGC